MRYLRALAETVERHADRPFLIDAQSGRVLTYSEADASARAVAAELRGRGLAAGDRLVLSLPNSAELALLYLGALYAGIVVVPLGSGFGRREVRTILERAAAALVVGDPADDRLAQAAAACETKVEALDPSMLSASGDEWEPFDGLSSDAMASVHFTSGTTGAPRGVGHRIRDFVANAQRFAQATGIDEQTRFYHPLPMTYMAGYYNLVLLPFTCGASVVIDRAFDARSAVSFWKAPRAHDVNALWLVPTIMALLMELDRGEDGVSHCRDNVGFVACGTAPLETELRDGFEKRYGVTVHESYGLSETLLATSSTSTHPAAAGTVGRPLPGVEIRVDAPVGEPGPILIDTPDLMAGYLSRFDQDPPFEVDLVEGRWLETGDIGVLDAEIGLRITGRAKEVIIRGGVNVSPGEIERTLRAVDGVVDVAVVGVPHAILGEDVAAVAVCANGQGLEAIEPALKVAANEALEPTQRPAVYLQIDDLPKTPTGKVRKGALRDLVIDRLGLPTAGKGFRVDTEVAMPAAGDGERFGRRAVDLSHPIREGMTTFPSPNHPRTEVTVLARHGVEGRATRRLIMGTHTGTHVDAPLHFIPGGGGVDSLALDALVGPAHLLDLTPIAPLEEIGVDRLRAAAGGRLLHPRVLLRCDWSERFDELAFYTESPFLSRDACAWLVDEGVRLIGMDIPSPDDPREGFGSDEDSPNHHLLLGRGVILLEYLTNMAALDGPEVDLVALPLKVAGGDGAPARVVAFPRRG